ncbi:AmmeMemoRadiSam system radical SAM enzyme [Candidatus Woesearchaeota archaeon]|nr:AmmeMemoRadiSam system radical SAM enzyme [Candidatus Woesearchaeota archaeon]
MREAMHYKTSAVKSVQCFICPRKCIINDKEYGFCRARKNINGKLFSMVYGAPCSVNADPIEKKPLFHFLPGTKTFSVGTAGCNLRCKYCQNWEISQAMPEEVPIIDIYPEEIVEKALAEGCESIAYTYTEPSVFYEYVLDTAKIAKKKGLKNIIVTNGFVNEEPLWDLCKYIDAANVDLKSFDDDFYRKIAGGWLEPVLSSLKLLKKEKVWIEITNMIIPGYNDDMEMIKRMCRWIKKELGEGVPMHFSRFFPNYLMKDVLPTEEKTLLKAAETAKKEGLDNVYIGNIEIEGWENTYCTKCRKVVVKRRFFQVVSNKLKDGKCRCGEKVQGVWE